MSEEKLKKRKSSSLLISLPAILTGCAAVIVAIGGLGGLITVLISLRPAPTPAPLPVATTAFSNENVVSSLPRSVPTFPETEVPTELPAIPSTTLQPNLVMPTLTPTITFPPTLLLCLH